MVIVCDVRANCESDLLRLLLNGFIPWIEYFILHYIMTPKDDTVRHVCNVYHCMVQYRTLCCLYICWCTKLYTWMCTVRCVMLYHLQMRTNVAASSLNVDVPCTKHFRQLYNDFNKTVKYNFYVTHVVVYIHCVSVFNIKLVHHYLMEILGICCSPSNGLSEYDLKKSMLLFFK